MKITNAKKNHSLKSPLDYLWVSNNAFKNLGRLLKNLL